MENLIRTLVDDSTSIHWVVSPTMTTVERARLFRSLSMGDILVVNGNFVTLKNIFTRVSIPSVILINMFRVRLKDYETIQQIRAAFDCTVIVIDSEEPTPDQLTDVTLHVLD